MKERIKWIDGLKCFAITLVVIGHIIQYVTNPTDFDSNILFRYIYSFHMALFMMVSGYLAPAHLNGGV